MATKPISTPLPADLPENWTTGQTVAPTGAEVGLTEQHGYNYLMQQVNAAQEAANTINDAFEDLPTIEDVTPSAIGALLAISAASAYDPSSTYIEGDYCTYQGQLYKANQDISTAEPWTAAHWTATSIMAEVGAHVEDKDNPHGVTAAQVGAIQAPAGGSAGQVLTKTQTAQEWKDPPPSAAAVTVTFTAEQWTGAEDPYTLTIPQTQHKRASADFIFQVFGMDGDGKYAKNTWEALEADMEYTASTGEFKLISATKFAGKIVFVG